MHGYDEHPETIYVVSNRASRQAKYPNKTRKLP
jgi:hypothetical protein